MSKLLHTKAEKIKLLTTFPSNAMGNDGDIALCSISGRGIYLCAKTNGRWHAANKMQDLNRVERTSVNELSLNKLKLGDASLTKDKYNKPIGDFTLDVGGDIILKSKEGNIKFFDSDNSDDYSTFNVGSDGGLTITTIDAATGLGNGYDADITLESDGKIILKSSDTLQAEIDFYVNGTLGASIRGSDAAGHYLQLNSRADNGDFFKVLCGAAGLTTISTTDDDGEAAHLRLDADGDVVLDPVSGITKFQKAGDADDLCTLTVAANGATTIATADSDGAVGHLTLDVDGDIELNADGGQVSIKDGSASHFLFNCDSTQLIIYDDTDEADWFSITVAASGVTTLETVDDGAAVGHLQLKPDGDLILDPVSQKTIINATDGLFFDGGNDTYIFEAAPDVLDIVVGGDSAIRIYETDDEVVTQFRASCAGFNRTTSTYNASDTDVNYRVTNKSKVTFGSGNITDMNLFFPGVSANFVLVLKQDGTGSRTVTNWKAFDSAENAANGSATVVWAGGSAPTLTTTANRSDILSFFWDAGTETAYGVATLDFAA